MVGLASGIVDRRENILALKIRIVFENFFEICSGAQKFQNVGYSDTHTTDARTTTTLAVIDRDAIEEFPLSVHTSISVYMRIDAHTLSDNLRVADHTGKIHNRSQRLLGLENGTPRHPAACNSTQPDENAHESTPKQPRGKRPDQYHYEGAPKFVSRRQYRQ